MKLITLFFCVTFFVHVYSGRREEALEKYHSLSNEEQLKCINQSKEACERGKFPPFIPSNEEELNRFCSLSLRFVPCIEKESEKCFGVNVVEGETAIIMRTLEKACDEDSVWYKALSKHLPCIDRERTSFNEKYNETCLVESKQIAESVSKILNIDFNKYENLEFESQEEFKKMMSYTCFKWSLNFNCLLRNIENCGMEAKNITLEIMNSFGWYMFRCKGTSPYYTAVEKIGLNDEDTNRIRYALHFLNENYVKYMEYLKEE